MLVLNTDVEFEIDSDSHSTWYDSDRTAPARPASSSKQLRLYVKEPYYYYPWNAYDSSTTSTDLDLRNGYDSSTTSTDLGIRNGYDSTAKSTELDFINGYDSSTTSIDLDIRNGYDSSITSTDLDIRNDYDSSKHQLIFIL